MNILGLKLLKALVLLVALLPTQKLGEGGSQQSEKKGTLIVLVTWGDVDNTPASDVYIEAHGFVRDYNSEKSFVLKSSAAGHYEASLPAGVYDVFVSESNSQPRCRRIRIVPGLPSTWTLKLEFDDVYTKGERI